MKIGYKSTTFYIARIKKAERLMDSFLFRNSLPKMKHSQNRVGERVLSQPVQLTEEGKNLSKASNIANLAHKKARNVHIITYMSLNLTAEFGTAKQRNMKKDLNNSICVNKKRHSRSSIPTIVSTFSVCENIKYF